MKSKAEFYNTAFARNIGIFTPNEQKKLGQARVAIAGMGGVGGVYLLNLVRTGISKFNIADFDKFELPNINRQAGANASSLGKSKVDVMAKMAKEINPHVSIKSFKEGINKKNIDSFFKGARVAIDGIDFFNIKDRLLFFKKAREYDIPVITAAPIGFGASLLVFSPKGMTFEDYFDIKHSASEQENLLSFALGLAPSLIKRAYFKPTAIDFKKKSSPSLAAGTLLCANLVICETVKIILGKKVKIAPFSSHFDPYTKQYKKVFLKKGNRS